MAKIDLKILIAAVGGILIYYSFVGEIPLQVLTTIPESIARIILIAIGALVLYQARNY